MCNQFLSVTHLNDHMPLFYLLNVLWLWLRGSTADHGSEGPSPLQPSCLSITLTLSLGKTCAYKSSLSGYENDKSAIKELVHLSFKQQSLSSTKWGQERYCCGACTHPGRTQKEYKHWNFTGNVIKLVLFAPSFSCPSEYTSIETVLEIQYMVCVTLEFYITFNLCSDLPVFFLFPFQSSKFIHEWCDRWYFFELVWVWTVLIQQPKVKVFFPL